jgi:DnaK suppressor protein
MAAAKDTLEPSLEMLGISPYKAKKDESYMSAKMRTHFINILTLLRQQIMEEADRTVHHMKDDLVNYADPNDRASQEEEFRLELRARDRERKLLKKIEESLQLLNDKEYGYCEICGVEIGLGRLEARPTATLCIDCKTLDEIREKQGG